MSKRANISALLFVCMALCFVMFTSQTLIGCGPGKQKEKVNQEKTVQADGGQTPDASVAPERKKPNPDQSTGDGDNPDEDDFLDLSITSLAATAQDKAFGKSEQFYINHPITVRLSVQTDEVVAEPISLGIYLVQKQADKSKTLDQLATCFLGTITFALIPKAKTDISQVKKFTIPSDCLVGPDGTKLDKSTFNLAVDPHIAERKKISKEEKQAGLIIFGDGWAEQGVAECSNVDPDKATFGCVEEFTVQRPKQGKQLDFVLDDFQTDTPVMVLVDRTRHPDATSDEQYDADININLAYQMRGSTNGTSHKPITLHYEVCAHKVYDCNEPTSWWPLSVYQRTKTAQNASVSTLLLKNSLSNSDEVRAHGLFAIGETLKKIKETKDYRYIIRATINRGDTNNPAVGELPTHALDEDNDNNFLEKEILIVIPSNAPKESKNLGKYYSFAKEYSITAGSKKILGLTRTFSTDHRLSTIGISSETSLVKKIVGWFPWGIYEVGYKLKVLPGMPAGLQAGFEAKLEWFESTIWEKSLPGPDLEYKSGDDLKFSKTKESKRRYWAKVIPIDIIFSITGEVGVEIEAKLETGLSKTTQGYPKGVLTATAKAEPYASIETGFKGYANLWRFRGGLAATVTLVKVSLPLEIKLQQTKYANDSIKAEGEVNLALVIELLKGELAIKLEKCSGWWNCEWKDWKKFSLYNFPGWEWKAKLLDRKKTWTFGKVPKDPPKPRPKP